MPCTLAGRAAAACLRLSGWPCRAKLPPDSLLGYQPTAPVLIRIETKAGHGADKPTSKIIEGQADQRTFLVEILGMRLPRPKGTDLRGVGWG